MGHGWSEWAAEVAAPGGKVLALGLGTGECLGDTQVGDTQIL